MVKAVLPVSLILLTIFITLYFVAVPYLESKLLDEKKTMLKELTQTAWEIMQDYDYKAGYGEYDFEEAQKQASDIIKNMKYGDDRKEYFWINDLQPVMIMHPYRSDLVGKNVAELKDPKGFPLMKEIVKLATSKGEGFLDYYWQKKDNAQDIAHKLSFIKIYKPWGWIIGTGVYIEDVEKELSGIRHNILLVFFVCLIVVGVISYFSIKHSIKIENDNNKNSIEIIKSREKYRNLAELLPEIIFECEKNGHLTFANKNAFEAYGYDKNDFNRGMNVLASVLPRERDRFLHIMNRTLKGELIGNKEFTAVRKDGSTFPVIFYTSPIYNEKEAVGIRGLIIDISERKTIEKKLIAITKKTQELNRTLEERVKERTAKLEEVNKELEAFSYSVAHDLRTPLGLIEGFAKTFDQEYHDLIDENGQMFLNTILKNIEGMFQLIEDILEFSKVNRGELQLKDINMKQMFEDIAKVHIDLSKGREIKLTIEDIANAKGDEGLIRQVVSNMISNAVKYTGKREVAEIVVDSYIEENEMIYFVKDNGAGFNQKYADKVFQVFQRVHDSNDFKGTGVGLAIVAKIIKRHGGRIWAEGEEGKGATFYFSLPL